MGDMMMYAVIAGIAAGVFFYMFKKSAAAITNQSNLKTARYAVGKLQNLLLWAPLSMIL